MNVKEQSPVVKFLLTASLILTVVNLTFVVSDRFREKKNCEKCGKEIEDG